MSAPTPSQLKVIATSIFVAVFPGIDATTRAEIISGLVSVYVGGNAVYKSVEVHSTKGVKARAYSNPSSPVDFRSDLGA